jgi:hypothetical protein
MTDERLGQLKDEIRRALVYLDTDCGNVDCKVGKGLAVNCLGRALEALGAGDQSRNAWLADVRELLSEIVARCLCEDTPGAVTPCDECFHASRILDGLPK